MKRRTFVAGIASAGTFLAASRAVFAQTTTSSASPTAGGEATPEQAAAQTGYAPVNGLQLYYEIHGGGGVSLVLLHGGFMNVDLWGPLLPGLAQTRQVIAVDLQGHGHTADIDRPFSFEQMADDIAALIAYLGLEQADLFGYSLGGGVALQTTIRHPELVRKLVLASTSFRRDGWYPAILAAERAMDADTMEESPFYDVYVAVAPNPDDWPALVAKTRELVSGADYDWGREVADIETPTLLIYGDADAVLPEHQQEFFHLLGGGVIGDLEPIPPAQLAVLPGTTHFGMLSRVDLLLAIVVPFLDTPLP